MEMVIIYLGIWAYILISIDFQMFGLIIIFYLNF